VVPVAEPDFYAFVNAARRMLDVNFKLDISFAFMFHEAPVYEWSDATFTQFIDNKSANFVVKSIYGVKTKDGHPARSTDWMTGRAARSRARSAASQRIRGRRAADGSAVRSWSTAHVIRPGGSGSASTEPSTWSSSSG